MTQPMVLAGLYGLAINLATFAAFWFDKRASIRGTWRTRESTLLGCAAVGGWIGALVGQQMLRHKTRKEPFRTLLWTIAVCETVALFGWLVLFR